MTKCVSSLIIIFMIVTMTATGSCDCLIPSNNTSPIDFQDFSSVFNMSSPDVIQNNFAALNQAMSLLNISFTPTQLAAFLGIVSYNTDNLQRHQARCADANKCSNLYDQVCSNRTTNDTRRFYPRAALMISYQCNYGDVDSVLRSVLPCLRSIEKEPNLLSDRLLYSYLASLIAWTQTECMSITQDNLDQLPKCVQILNPWICTRSGLKDRRQLALSLNSTLLALNISNAGLKEDTSCNLSLEPQNSTFVSSFAPNNATNSNFSQVCNATETSNFTIAAETNDTSHTSTSVDPKAISNMTSDPTNVDLSAGALTRQIWQSYFPNSTNATLVNSHYDALAAALIFKHYEDIDSKAIALLLATISIQTSNLTDVQVNNTDANRVRISVEVMLKLLSRGLPIEVIAKIDPDLTLFYMNLAAEIIRSGCFQDIQQTMYAVCLEKLFPEDTCAFNSLLHDSIVEENKRALKVLQESDDLSFLRCDYYDFTSNAALHSPFYTMAVIIMILIIV